MHKIAIANYGPANQGKSETIREVVNVLFKLYPALERVDINIGADITVIITGTIKGVEVKIGIESQGDPGSRLFESLPYFVEQKCNIIICATRSYGRTTEAVSELHLNHSYDVIWCTNLRAPQKDKAETSILNKFSAKQIVETLEAVITGQL